MLIKDGEPYPLDLREKGQIVHLEIERYEKMDQREEIDHGNEENNLPLGKKERREK